MSIYGTPVGGLIKEKDPTVSDWAKEDTSPIPEVTEVDNGNF